jgi:hypothetical protein
MLDPKLEAMHADISTADINLRSDIALANADLRVDVMQSLADHHRRMARLLGLMLLANIGATIAVVKLLHP